MTGTPWVCRKCGTVLGYWERKCVQYGDAMYHREELATVAGPVLIGAGHVPCACGTVRTWEPGKQMQDALIEGILISRKEKQDA